MIVLPAGGYLFIEGCGNYLKKHVNICRGGGDLNIYMGNNKGWEVSIKAWVFYFMVFITVVLSYNHNVLKA